LVPAVGDDNRKVFAILYVVAWLAAMVGPKIAVADVLVTIPEEVVSVNVVAGVEMMTPLSPHAGDEIEPVVVVMPSKVAACDSVALLNN